MIQCPICKAVPDQMMLDKNPIHLVCYHDNYGIIDSSHNDNYRIIHGKNDAYVLFFSNYYAYEYLYKDIYGIKHWFSIGDGHTSTTISILNEDWFIYSDIQKRMLEKIKTDRYKIDFRDKNILNEIKNLLLLI